jgi:hypothetical protein
MIRLLRKKYTTKRDMEIDIFFKHVNWYKLLRAWDLFPSFHAASETILELKRNQKKIKKMWHDNPTLSLPALLTSMNLLTTKIVKRNRGENANWYFSSIDDLFVVMGIPEREHFIWCTMFNRLGIRRKYPDCVLIKDLSTEHIRKILKGRPVGTIKTRFRTALLAELERRGKTL